MSWRILHGVRAHVTWYMKDDIDHHPNWLAWYTCCTILAYMAVIFNERDLTFCLFLLIWCHLQRSLEFSVLSVLTMDRLLYFWPHIRCVFYGYMHWIPTHWRDSKMSSRFAKNGDKSADRTASGRPTSLREISHTGWREWDNHMVELKGCCSPVYIAADKTYCNTTVHVILQST